MVPRWSAVHAAGWSPRRSQARLQKRQYLFVVSAAQFREAVLDKLARGGRTCFVFDGLRDEDEVGAASVRGLAERITVADSAKKNRPTQQESHAVYDGVVQRHRVLGIAQTSQKQSTASVLVVRFWERPSII